MVSFEIDHAAESFRALWLLHRLPEEKIEAGIVRRNGYDFPGPRVIEWDVLTPDTVGLHVSIHGPFGELTLVTEVEDEHLPELLVEERDLRVTVVRCCLDDPIKATLQ